MIFAFIDLVDSGCFRVVSIDQDFMLVNNHTFLLSTPAQCMMNVTVIKLGLMLNPLASLDGELGVSTVQDLL